MADLRSTLNEHFEATLSTVTTSDSRGFDMHEIGIVDASIGGILEVVKSWLSAADVLPSKEDVLKFVGEAYDQYISPKLEQRPIINSLVRQGLLAAVGVLYDSLI